MKIGMGGCCWFWLGAWRGDERVDEEGEVLAEGTLKIVGVLRPSLELLDFLLLRGVPGVEGVEGESGTENRAIAAVRVRLISQCNATHSTQKFARREAAVKH